MKHKLAILLGLLLCAGAFAPMTTQAIGIRIEIGDRGYYNHGGGIGETGCAGIGSRAIGPGVAAIAFGFTAITGPGRIGGGHFR